MNLFNLSDDKEMALAGFLTGLGGGMSRASRGGANFLGALAEGGQGGFNSMLGFQQMASMQGMRQLQQEQLKRKIQQDDATRRALTGEPSLFSMAGSQSPPHVAPQGPQSAPGLAPPMQGLPGAQPAPSGIPAGALPPSLTGQPMAAPQNGPSAPRTGGVPPLLQGLPPEVAGKIQELARSNPEAALKMTTDLTMEMVKAGRWEVHPHPQDPTTLISVDKYGMRPPVAFPKPFARELMERAAGATRVISAPQISNVGESEFSKQAGGDLAKFMGTAYQGAVNAPKTLEAINTARQAFAGGMPTGLGADAKLTFGKALKAAGFDVYGDEIANAETFLASTGNLVAGILSSGAFGSGSGISERDLMFVRDLAANRISLDDKSIPRVLDIADRAARFSHRTFTQQRNTLRNAGQNGGAGWNSLPPSVRELWGAVPDELPGFVPIAPPPNPVPSPAIAPTAPRGGSTSRRYNLEPRK